MSWGSYVRGLCLNVPWGQGEGLQTIGLSCERTMSECAI